MRVETLKRIYRRGTILAWSLLRSLDTGYFVAVLRILRRLLGTAEWDSRTPTPAQLSMRMDRLERAEIERAAEHAAMIDRLERLYKRVSVRIAREGAGTLPESGSSIVGQPESTESPLDMRQRLRRG